jgi:hypothetical protein
LPPPKWWLKVAPFDFLPPSFSLFCRQAEGRLDEQSHMLAANWRQTGTDITAHQVKSTRST